MAPLFHIFASNKMVVPPENATRKTETAPVYLTAVPIVESSSATSKMFSWSYITSWLAFRKLIAVIFTFVALACYIADLSIIKFIWNGLLVALFALFCFLASLITYLKNAIQSYSQIAWNEYEYYLNLITALILAVTIALSICIGNEGYYIGGGFVGVALVIYLIDIIVIKYKSQCRNAEEGERNESETLNSVEVQPQDATNNKE